MSLDPQELVRRYILSYRTDPGDIFYQLPTMSADSIYGFKPSDHEDPPYPGSSLPDGRFEEELNDVTAESQLPGAPEDDSAKGRLPLDKGVTRGETGRKLPSSFPQDRTNTIPRFEFNTPSSEPDSRSRSITKVPVRTVGVPGDLWGNPVKEDYGYVTRRVFEAGAFPVKQRKQQGNAKRYSARWYLKNRRKHIRRQDRRYEKIKRRGMFKRVERLRDKYPFKYERKPAGGVKNPADRTTKWRQKQRVRRTLASSEFFFPFLYGPSYQEAEVIDFHPDSREIVFLVEVPRGVVEGNLEPEEFLMMSTFKDSQTYAKFLATLEVELGVDVYEHDPDGMDDPFDLDDQGRIAATQSGTGYLFKHDTQSPETRKSPLDDSQTTGVPRGIDEVKELSDVPRTWPGNHTKNPAGLFNNISPVLNAPGNSKVIQWNADISNNQDFAIKTAMAIKISETLKVMRRWTNRKLKTKSKTYKPSISNWDKKNHLWTFKVGDYSVKVQAHPRKDRRQNIKGMDLDVSCTCPFWQWRGPEHWAKEKDYQFGSPRGTASFPRIRDPKHKHAVCKHALAVFDYIDANKLKIHKRL